MEIWAKLTDELNAIGVGPQKTVAEWKRCFQMWKAQSRYKARLIKVHGEQTGGGPASRKTLSDLEERMLSAYGREAIDGTGIGDTSTVATIDNRRTVPDRRFQFA